MTLWIIILFVLLVFSFKKHKDIIYWISALILILLAGLRDISVGIDTSNYALIFRVISHDGSSWVEPGWIFLNSMVSKFGGDFNALLILVHALMIVPICLIYKKVSPNPMFSLFVYYALYIYLNSFNIMRQTLAVSIVFIALFCIQNKQILLSILIIFIASSIHISALIVLPMVFFDKFSINNHYIVYTLLLISIFVGFILNENAFRIIALQYSGHLDTVHGFRNNYISAFLLSVVITILFVYFYNKTDDNLKNNIFFKAFFISVVLNNVIFKLALGTRLTMYFTIAQTIVYPFFFDKKYMQSKWLIILYLCAIFLKIAIMGGDLVCPEYKFAD